MVQVGELLCLRVVHNLVLESAVGFGEIFKILVRTGQIELASF
jgi:hypothetical protein